MNLSSRLPPTTERVSRHTADEVNEAIRLRTDTSIAILENASDEEIGTRLAELDREWDIERVLQTNASLLALTGLLLGARVNRNFLLLPAVVFTFLTQHALQGWCPPIPVFRRLGIRTAAEIARERYALKLLRGDFDQVPAAGRSDSRTRVRAALAAVDA